MDQTFPKLIDDLVNKVKQSYYNQDKYALENVFFSLQQAMLGTLEERGENTYPLKHMGKERRRREGTLGVRLLCPYELVFVFVERLGWALCFQSFRPFATRDTETMQIVARLKFCTRTVDQNNSTL